jgi:drug/metabolite transporter (DMT)-like permease
MNDAIMKWLSADYPVGQIMFVRGLFVFIPVLALAWHEGGLARLRVRNRRGQAIRAAFVVAGMFLFVSGLRFMPLADAVAISFASPLIGTAFAVPLLGERVGWRRWTAVVVGLVGVIIMLRPSGSGIAWAALLPLGAAATGALRDIVTRRLSVSDSSSAILFVTTIAVTLSGLVATVAGPVLGLDFLAWRPIPLDHVAMLALAGFLLGTAQYLIIEAVRHAEIGLVAPFKYTSMVWAVLVGLVAFGTAPDRWILLGSGLVIAGGIYIVRREARLRAAS